jgi:hypothetical protein
MERVRAAAETAVLLAGDLFPAIAFWLVAVVGLGLILASLLLVVKVWGWAL